MANIQTPAGEVSHGVTVDDVKALHIKLVAVRANPRDVAMGLRTEVHEALQAHCPFPDEDAVTDAHRIQSDKDRKADPNHADAHHWLQKKHGMALWDEADRLIAEAGLGGAS